jgi:hypothetical protein
MATYMTNRGKSLYNASMLTGQWLTTAATPTLTASVPANFFFMLATAVTGDFRDIDISSSGQITPLAEANGYTALSIARNGTNFPAATEDDTNDQSSVICGASIQWTASGGSIAAAYGLLCDIDPYPGPGNVLCVVDFGGTQTATSGNTFTVQNFTMRLTKGFGET